MCKNQILHFYTFQLPPPPLKRANRPTMHLIHLLLQTLHPHFALFQYVHVERWLQWGCYHGDTTRTDLRHWAWSTILGWSAFRKSNNTVEGGGGGCGGTKCTWLARPLRPQPHPFSSVSTRDIKNRHHIDKIEAHKPSLISLVKINELVFAVFVQQLGSSPGSLFSPDLHKTD